MSGSESPAYDVAGISVSGPETAETILMLHMGGVNRHMWREVVAELDGSFRCVTADLPGHGELADQEFTVDAAIARIDTVCEALDVGSVTLVGVSVGGYIAQAYAADNPERVDGLVICGATAPLTGPRAVAFKTFGSVLPVLLPVVGGLMKKKFSESLREDLDPAVAEAIISGGLSPEGGAQVFRRLSGTDYAQAMAGYAGPIVVANGEDDKMNRKAEERFLDLFPAAEVVTVTNAGHAAPMEQPEAFAPAVRKLSTLSGS